MEINFDAVLLGYTGEPILKDAKPVTVGYILQQALDVPVKEHSPEMKYSIGKIIPKLIGVNTLSDVETKVIKELVSICYGPFLIAKLWDILDGKGE